MRPEPNSWSLAALATPVLLSSLGAGIANVGLPALADAFDASFHAVQWVVLAYLLAITTLIVGVGRLADLVGRRRLLLGGLALFTVASLASASAPALWVLVAARAVQGLGAAVMMTLAMALVGDATPPERTGWAMGVLGSMSAVGTALGPALGGLLLEVAGWRGLFLINVPLGAVALLIARRHLPPDRELRDVGRPAFDLPGTLLLALTLGAYALAMTAGRGEDGYLNVALLLLAALGGAAFVRSQARSQSPLLHLDLLRGGTLGVQLLVSVVASAVVMATLVVGPFYLTRGLGLAPVVIGGLLSVGPLVSAAAGVPAGRLVDRLGARGSTAVGLAGMAAGSVLLAALRPSLGIIGYVLPIAALTASYALVQAANSAAAMMDVGADGRGVVAALLGLSRNLGLVTGASAMGAVFALASGVPEVATASPAAAAAGLRVTFVLAAALTFLTLAVVMRGAWVRAVATAVVIMSVGATVVRAQVAPTTARSGPMASLVDPYPASAAGWGPRAGGQTFISRWAEDWSRRRAAGNAPPLEAMPIGCRTSLTLRAEARLRHDARGNDQLARERLPADALSWYRRSRPPVRPMGEGVRRGCDGTRGGPRRRGGALPDALPHARWAWRRSFVCSTPRALLVQMEPPWSCVPRRRTRGSAWLGLRVDVQRGPAAMWPSRARVSHRRPVASPPSDWLQRRRSRSRHTRSRKRVVPGSAAARCPRRHTRSPPRKSRWRSRPSRVGRVRVEGRDHTTCRMVTTLVPSRLPLRHLSERAGTELRQGAGERRLDPAG